jgi:hypothetical protein
MSNGLRPALATVLACFLLSSAFPAWSQEDRRDDSRGDNHGQAPGSSGGARPDARGSSGDHHAEGQYREGDFRDHRDPRTWDDHDRAVWRGGNWHQDWHDGRYGWWWEVAGIWYFYDQPVYPYPLAVSGVVDLPGLVVAPAVGIGVVAMPPPPPQPAAPPMPVAAQPGTWYYCDNPPGYYPYVPTCAAAWRPVPAQTR